ncbi:MAG TPA: helix-turn-helix domain-containing protein, partial [Bacillota bacterium]|nr:helix-turn-helix domain-containing protein [Bacillota bacterium]
NYSWPGNVRQLENTIEQLVAVGEERQPVERTEVDRVLARYAAPGRRNRPDAGAPTAVGAIEDCSLRRIETEVILRTLDEAGGNKAETARRLGISKTTLWRRLKQIDTRA